MDTASNPDLRLLKRIDAIQAEPPFSFDEKEGKRRLFPHGGEIYSVARAAQATQALFSAHDVLPFTYKKRQIKYRNGET